MSISTSTVIPEQFDTLVLDVAEDGSLGVACDEFKKIYEDFSEENQERKISSARVYGLSLGTTSFSRLVFTPRPKKGSATGFRSQFGKLAKEIDSLHGKNALFIPHPSFPKHAWKPAAEGFILGQYKFETYKGMPEKDACNMTFLTESNEDAREGGLIAKAVCKARDLTNEPSNVMTPEALAQEALKLEGLGVEVSVFGLEEIRRQRMNAFLAVARGSSKEPRLIVADYNGAPGSGERLAIIGKAICFDSGGYSMKTPEGMYGMKTDMEGAAIALGAIAAAAEAKLRINLTAIAAACENMVSAESIVPGDIVQSRSGAFIEIVNTDAEGRLTLADAISYAAEEKGATKILDIATLTGSCANALGFFYIGAFSNNDEFYKVLEKSSEESGDCILRLPLDDEYKEMYKSNVAKFKNSGSRHGGAIIAALFLGEFAGSIPWVHLDIAGTGRSEKNSGIYSIGATGTGLGLIYSLSKNLQLN
ncbi:MAG: leucyl aminopeptidase family protein [Clostridiales bacterium]|nr:leucyl aminopeptidase family protein [Clostridiales bacterium]